MKLNDKKLKTWTIVGIVLLAAAVLTFVLCLALVPTKTNDGTEVSKIQLMTDIIAHDPTKLDVPSWVITLMEVSMYVVIGVLGFGIVTYSIYIIGHFVKRRLGTLSAQVSEQVEEHEENPNLVKLSLREEVANEESN